MLHVQRIAVVFLLALAGCEPADGPDLYARVEKRLAGEPGLAASLGAPAPEMKVLAWLVGEWDVEARVTGKSERAPERGHSTVTTIHGGVWFEIRDTYPTGVQDVGYLGYSAVTGRWTSISLDSVGNANITSAPAWQNESLAFEGDVVVLGVAAHLRQTLHRINADEYEIINEERIGGAWRKLDAYHYRRTR